MSADAVVLATGNWTGPLLWKTVGLRLPLAYVRHQYSIRRDVPNIHPDLPSVRVVDYAVYARPVGTDLMFGTYEPHPLTVDPMALPARTEHVPLDDSATNEALDHAGRLFPGVVDSVVDEMRGGVVTMTPDGSYVIDQCEDATGLYFLSGCNVMGLSAAPALGEDVAGWIADGSRPESLTGFALSRFSVDGLGEDEHCRRALREYEAIYRDALSRERVRIYGG
jgi:glycine/D-amino acid oxidase-like deaminating enzyme